jgi:hypothetical protein
VWKRIETRSAVQASGRWALPLPHPNALEALCLALAERGSDLLEQLDEVFRIDWLDAVLVESGGL